MEHNTAIPETVTVPPDEVPVIDVPQSEWPDHVLLKRANLNSSQDALEWPGSTFQQLAVLRRISLVASEGRLLARLDAQFNFDLFVNSATDEDSPAHPAEHQPDRPRYYTRVTNGGFHLVGAFSAVTLDNRRKYFQWLTGGWVNIGLLGFLYVRDDVDTHFSEVTAAQFFDIHPDAAGVEARVEPVAMRESGVHRASPSAVAHEPVEAGPAVQEQPAEPEPAAPAVPAVPLGAIQRSIAIALATVTLRGRLDLMGGAVVDHSARVAESFDAVSDNVRHCAAWLHDVLEYSDVTERDLLDAGLSPDIVDIVTLLTRRADVTEEDWLSRVASHPDARAVKLAALADNSAPWRSRRLDSPIRNDLEQKFGRIRAILAAGLDA